MLSLNECNIEPGDILFVVAGRPNNLLLRIKQWMQSIPTPSRRHGHMEVISVFVCSGENKYGKIFYNHERPLRQPITRIKKNLHQQSLVELKESIFKLCLHHDDELLKETLNLFSSVPNHLASQIDKKDEIDNIYTSLIDFLTLANKKETKTRPSFYNVLHKIIIRFFGHHERNKLKDNLVDFLTHYWSLSGESQVLNQINHSLLVFKHNSPIQRENFLKLYQKQIEITKNNQEKGQNRTSILKILIALFKSAKQDQYDKTKHEPNTGTFCSSNVIEVLNELDPDLVKRGRYSLPKELEAGMRDELTPKPIDPTSNETMNWETIDKASPSFSLIILPSLGKELMSTLSTRIFEEISRLNKNRNNPKVNRKISLIEQVIAPYRNLNHPCFSYGIHGQVEEAITLLAKLLPLLDVQTGYKNPLGSHSHRMIRAFARTQGIFDGDIRRKIAELESKQSETLPQPKIEQKINSDKSIIFSDWSYHCWSHEKKEQFIKLC